jgi:choline dehydrogenase-like flavoprotein
LWFGHRSGFLKEAGNPDSWRDDTGIGIGALKFGKEYRNELFDSKNIKVLLHANAVDLITNNDINHVNLLKISNLSRVRESKIIADTFVLCAGGFENPRILLNSGNRDNGGIANNNGLVGKYYLGHPFADLGTLVTRDQEHADKIGHVFSMNKVFRKNLLEPHLRFSNTCLNNNKMLNCGIEIISGPDKNSGIYSAIQIYRQLILNKTLPDNLTENMINVLKDIDDVIAQSFRNANDEPSKVSSSYTPRFVIPKDQSMRIWGIVEQAPISDSKVHLSTNQDELGLNKIIVDWKTNGQEKQTMRRALIILGNEFGRLNIGRVKIDDWLLEDDNLLGPLSDTGIGSHPAGTTRMSTTSVSGVVDVNCRSHFIDNLYISGSSIFPTNSYVSPTHTIVALSIKLADHIKRNLVHKSQT